MVLTDQEKRERSQINKAISEATRALMLVESCMIKCKNVKGLRALKVLIEANIESSKDLRDTD